jgi:Zn-dependent protease with chaperone function
VLTASIALALLALALAWPAPVALSAARWPARSPATALLLWQSIALAGGLSMIGALLTFGLIPFGSDLVGGLVGLARVAGGAAVDNVALTHVFALAGAVLLGGHLVLNLALTADRARRQRQRHRRLVELLSSPVPDEPRSRMLDTATPVAYCLPGTGRSMTVFSAGLVELLSAAELRAVIEHEKAHLDQRHHLVLLAFRAWNASLPWFPIASRARREVGLLVEMLADDRARRVVDDQTLATAIALVAGGTGDAAPIERDDDLMEQASPAEVTPRVRRLLAPAGPLPLTARGAVVSVAFALIGVPTVLLLAPAVTALAALSS